MFAYPSCKARVAALLEGNDAPNDADRAKLRAFLDEAQGELARYDENRDKLQSCIQKARTLLHPIRTLCDDVLDEIFAHCFPEWDVLERKLRDERDSEYSSLNSGNAPWTLSQVCSGWRRVALSAPRLWSTIIFTSPALPDNSKARSRKLDRFCYNLGLFISRSRNHDLSVAISVPQDEIIPEMIFAHLAVGAARWHRLCFRADGNEFPAALSELYFKRLEEVILFDMEETRTMDGKLLAPFRTAPRLRRMYLCDEEFIALPWSRITHYECDIYLNPWTLRSMPNLTHLALHVDDPRAKVHELLPKLSFPNLLSLSLALRSCTFFSALLPHLEVPALTDFRLTYLLGLIKPENRPSFSALSLPATDIFPKRLTSLHIACDVPDFIDADYGDVLTSWLYLAPDVTAFSLRLPSIHVALILDLLVHAKGDAQLPRLRSLDLWVTAKEARMPVAMVLDVLESRSGSKQNVARLEEFSTNVDASQFSEGRLERWEDICRKVKVICPR